MLITIEGIDGSGKSTVWANLHTQIAPIVESDVTFTREPTDSKYGKLLRENLRNDTANPMSELFLFMTDHATHVEETIKPTLDAGNTIISDRYISSRCVYQAYTLQEELTNPTEYIYNLHKEWSIIPDLTLLLDVDVSVAVDRLDTDEKYETKERLSEIKSNYETLYTHHPERYTKIDAGQPIEAVIAECKEAIKESTTT